MTATNQINNQEDWQSYLNSFHMELEENSNGGTKELAADNKGVFDPESDKVDKGKSENFAESNIYFVDKYGNYYLQTTKEYKQQINDVPPPGSTVNKIKVPSLPKRKSPKSTITNKNSTIMTRSITAAAAKSNKKNINENVEHKFVLENNDCEISSENEELLPGNENLSEQESNKKLTKNTKDKENKIFRVRDNNTNNKKAALTNHKNVHLSNKPYNCKDCTKCFITSAQLSRHRQNKHSVKIPHKCTECDYTNVQISQIRRHMRSHTGEKPHQCPDCTYASTTAFKLKRHMRTHTGEKPYECDICHARFTQSYSLKLHKFTHGGLDKPVFQCELCPTTCGRKFDLRQHMQNLHNSDHPIVCKRCNKSLPDRYTYKIHVKTHEGERCFSCDICPYRSLYMSNLRKHKILHTHEHPFKCNPCGRTFKLRSLLKRHTNLYHAKDYVPPKPREKQHVCPHCNNRYTHKGNLIRHMEKHDPDSNAMKLKSQECVESKNNQIDTTLENCTINLDELMANYNYLVED